MNIKVYIWILRGILLGRVPASALGQYFRAERTTRLDETQIQNPTTDVGLYTHVHYPKDASSARKYPGIVLIPGAINASNVFDRRGDASILAMNGLVVIHWDPEGRGKSGGEENAGGFAHQDGFHAILKYLESLPFVDKENIGIVSYSYGVTFAGGVTRYPDNPKIKFWLDWEGPSDRKAIEKPLLLMPERVHLPLHALTDENYWKQREAVTFLKELNCPYLRIQAAHDHAQPDNEHCVQCINAVTHKRYGGQGVSPWTRVNDEEMNQPNTVYEFPNRQPNYLPKAEAGWLVPRVLKYIKELLELNLNN